MVCNTMLWHGIVIAWYKTIMQQTAPHSYVHLAWYTNTVVHYSPMCMYVIIVVVAISFFLLEVTKLITTAAIKSEDSTCTCQHNNIIIVAGMYELTGVFALWLITLRTSCKQVAKSIILWAHGSPVRACCDLICMNSASYIHVYVHVAQVVEHISRILWVRVSPEAV